MELHIEQVVCLICTKQSCHILQSFINLLIFLYDFFSLSLRLEESWKIYVPLVVTLRYGIHTKYYDTNADLKFLIKVCFYFLTWQLNRFISMQLPT